MKDLETMQESAMQDSTQIRLLAVASAQLTQPHLTLTDLVGFQGEEGKDGHLGEFTPIQKESRHSNKMLQVSTAASVHMDMCTFSEEVLLMLHQCVHVCSYIQCLGRGSIYMSICIYIYVSIYTYIYCIYTYVYMYICVLYTSVYMYTHISTCSCVQQPHEQRHLVRQAPE